ncbi:MAG: hypothetical protein ABI419_01730 [Ginsengibacter sp.]
MGNGAKIHLSTFETEVVTDTSWILTKQAIIEKIYSFFGEMHDVYKAISIDENKLFPGLDFIKNGKISKGENYLGLPYVILDYPSFFKRDNIFTVRTMFWWGNFFSITLHLSGKKRIENSSLQNLLAHLKKKNFFVCINEDEWQHVFDSTNYIAANEIDKKQWERICIKSFFKISKKIDLIKWYDAPQFLEKSYRELMELMKISFPAGEKVL